MSAGAASKMLDSVNSREISLTVICVSCSEDEGKHTASVPREHMLFSGNPRNLYVEEFR